MGNETKPLVFDRVYMNLVMYRLNFEWISTTRLCGQLFPKEKLRLFREQRRNPKANEIKLTPSRSRSTLCLSSTEGYAVDDLVIVVRSAHPVNARPYPSDPEDCSRRIVIASLALSAGDAFDSVSPKHSHVTLLAYVTATDDPLTPMIGSKGAIPHSLGTRS
jgi:hypothetical protein